MTTLCRQIVRALAPCIVQIAAVALTLPGCDESLPPRNDPTNLLHAVLLIQGGEFTFRYTEPAGYTPMSLAIQVYNDYDEVFEDLWYMRGTVEIWDTRRPNVRSSVDLRGSAVVPSYAENNGILTIEAGARLTFKNQWSHMITVLGERVPIWQGVDTVARLDPYGQVYYVTEPLYLGAQATLKIFQKTPAIKTPACYFTAVYRIYVPLDTGHTAQPSLQIQ